MKFINVFSEQFSYSEIFWQDCFQKNISGSGNISNPEKLENHKNEIGQNAKNHHRICY